MPIVTLITDLGKDTHEVAKVKMKLLSALPSATVIDISHAVSPFLVEDAVYFAKSCINDFPKDTIHLIAVDIDMQKHQRIIACRYKGQIFVTADNGFLSMLTNNIECEYYEILTNTDSQTSFSPLKDLLVPIAVEIIEKGVDSIGKSIDSIVEKTVEQPVVLENGLRGKVIYVNNYNNAVTNITRALFDNERVGRRFNVVLNRFDSILKLSDNYSDVEVGDSLCFFNEEGLLEIAVNKGKASELLGLGKDKRITIEFFTERTTSQTNNDGLFNNDYQNS